MDILELVPWWLAFIVLLVVLAFELWFLTRDRRMDN
jgi:hypothetical protein